MAAAIAAGIEMLLGLAHLLFGKFAVEVELEQLLTPATRCLAHAFLSDTEEARDCLSSRRAMCSLDMTVPTGMARI